MQRPQRPAQPPPVSPWVPITPTHQSGKGQLSETDTQEGRDDGGQGLPGRRNPPARRREPVPGGPAAILHQVPLFAAFSPEQMERILLEMRTVRLKSGDALFHEGQAATRFFYVHRGLMKLYRVSVDGTEKVVQLIHPGMVFAEAVMFMEESTYPVGAASLKATELWAFNNRSYLNLLRESPETSFRMLAEMSNRLRFWLQEVDTICLQSATRRLINFLLSQLPPAPVLPCVVELAAPKSVIASRLSIQPETFSRILNSLRKNKIIAVNNKTIQILDLDALRDSSFDCPRQTRCLPPG